MLSVEPIKNALGRQTGLKIQLANAVCHWELEDRVMNISRKVGVVDACFNPVAYRGMIKETIEKMCKAWVPTGKLAKVPKNKSQAWFLKKFSKLINWAVYPHWQAIISSMDGQDLQLCNMLFQADVKAGYGGIAILKGISGIDPMYLREIRTYKAAALLAVNTGITFQQYSDWRRFYALNGEVTPALRETLDNFRSVVPFEVLKRLSHVNVERPLYNKIEIISSIASYYHQRPLVQRSEKKAIKVALKKVGCDNLRKTFTILGSTSKMTEYPDKATDVVDLAEKRLNMQGGGMRNRVWSCYDENRDPLTMDIKEIAFKSPIPLPNEPGVTPIITMEDLWKVPELVPSTNTASLKKLFEQKSYRPMKPAAKNSGLWTPHAQITYPINESMSIIPFIVEHDGFRDLVIVYSDGYIEADSTNPAGEHGKFLLQNFADDLSEEDFAL
jgi:hypothetical protein